MPRPSPRGARRGRRGSGSRAGRGTRRTARAWPRCRPGRARPRRSGRAGPATTPAMTSLWPPRNLVADSTTRSAPRSSGRQTYGEANVLSTTYRAPWPCASAGEGGVVGHVGRRVGDRLGVEHLRRGGRQRGLDRGVVGRVHDLDLDAEAAEHAQELLSGRAVRRDRCHDPVAGADQRGECGVDRAHPRREGDARLAAGQLGVGRTERGGGRVARCGCRRSRRDRRPRPGRARPRRPRRTSRSGRSARWSGSGRPRAPSTRRGSHGSRSPWPPVAGGTGDRSRSDATPASPGGPSASAACRSRGPCRRVSRRTSRRRR